MARQGEGNQQPEQNTIIVEDAVLRAGFTQVPNALLTMPGVTHGAKLTYALLLSYSWQAGSCFPGQDALARDLCVERKAVIRYLKELKDKGLVVVERRGLGLTNIYRLPKLPDVPKMGHQEVPSLSQPEVPPVGHKEYSKEKDSKEKYPSNVRKGNLAENKQGDGAGSSGTPDSFLEGDHYEPSPNGPKSPSAGFTSLGDVIAARRAEGASGGRTASQKTHSEERQRILADIERFARELGDEAPLPSSVSRAYNLWQRSGIPIEAFTSLMYEAKSLTWEYSHKISKTKQPKDGERSVWGPEKNRMAYYFSILEHLVDRSTGGRKDPAPELNGTVPDDGGEALQNTLPDAPESLTRPVSRSRRPVRRRAASSALTTFIADLAEEFGDRANAPAYLGEALGLYAQSELPEDAFLQVLSVARTMTQGKVNGQGSPMSQLFEIVAKQLGIDTSTADDNVVSP